MKKKKSIFDKDGKLKREYWKLSVMTIMLGIATQLALKQMEVENFGNDINTIYK